MATLPEILAIYAGSDSTDGTWPPPGTHIIPVAHPELWALVAEDSFGSAPEDGRLYFTSLSDFVVGVPAAAVAILARLAAEFVNPIASAAGTLGQWPVVWRAEEGQTMRWIKSTFRGDLGGGVEQFQFSLNWGNPGDDPDIDEAAALTFAEQLATLWADQWDNPTSFLALRECFSADVRFLEVGVTTCTQTDGTAADGSGGNLEQSYGTQWFGYPTIGRPTGSVSTFSLPYEVSCAVSLQTEHRGASGRGRIYLPPFTRDSMAAGGRYSGAYVGTVADAIKAFLNSVNTAGPYVPVIVSRRRIILNEITALNVGAVPDSQRRRRRNQDEARLEVTL